MGKKRGKMGEKWPKKSGGPEVHVREDEDDKHGEDDDGVDVRGEERGAEPAEVGVDQHADGDEEAGPVGAEAAELFDRDLSTVSLAS